MDQLINRIVREQRIAQYGRDTTDALEMVLRETVPAMVMNEAKGLPRDTNLGGLFFVNGEMITRGEAK